MKAMFVNTAPEQQVTNALPPGLQLTGLLSGSSQVLSSEVPTATRERKRALRTGGTGSAPGCSLAPPDSPAGQQPVPSVQRGKGRWSLGKWCFSRSSVKGNR